MRIYQSEIKDGVDELAELAAQADDESQAEMKVGLRLFRKTVELAGQVDGMTFDIWADAEGAYTRMALKALQQTGDFIGFKAAPHRPGKDIRMHFWTKTP